MHQHMDSICIRNFRGLKLGIKFARCFNHYSYEKSTQ